MPASKARAGNRTGGPFQEKSSGRWVQVCYCGRRDAPSHKLTATSKAAVKRKYQDHQEDVQKGLNPDPPASLAVYLETYPQGRPALRARASTVDTYTRTLARVVPHVRTVTLKGFTARHAQAMFAKLLDEGYAPGTVRHTRTVLSVALNDAVRDSLVVRNVVADTDPPRDEGRAARGRWLSRVQLDHLFATAEVSGDDFWPLWTVMFFTGLRISEVLGLKWEDIDWQAASLHHQRQVLRSRGDQPRFYFDLPKGGARAMRWLPLLPQATRALRAQEALQGQQRTQATVWSIEWEGLVFTSPSGEPLYTGTVGAHFRQALAGAGLPRDIRPHDLRHSRAAYLRAQGIEMAMIADILGHADTGVTRRFYAHTDLAALRTAMEQAERRS